MGPGPNFLLKLPFLLQFFYKSFFVERKCEKAVRLYNMRWEELTIIFCQMGWRYLEIMGPGPNFNRASLSRKSSLPLFLLVFLFFLVKIFVKFE